MPRELPEWKQSPEPAGRRGFIYLVLICLVFASLITSTSATPQSTSPVIASQLFNEQELNWLHKQTWLDAGVMDDWPPISQADPNARAVGIDPEIVAELNQRLGGKIRLHVAPWDSIYQGMRQGRLDLIMGITPRDFRRPYMDFTTPYLQVPHVIVARNDETRFFASETDLDGKTLALEKDFVNVDYFRNNFPNVSITTWPNTLDALEAVSRGDADAYAGSRVVVLHLIQSQLLSNLRIHGRLARPPTELAIGSRKDAPLLAAILQKALSDIPAEDLRRIISR